ncbi:MAG: methyltransferase domain-containing protein [Candidatus Desantisbacteria bacterium]
MNEKTSVLHCSPRIALCLNGLDMIYFHHTRNYRKKRRLGELKTMCKIPITVKKCGLCRGNALLRYEKMKGYIEGSFFDIYECSFCNATFVDPLKSDEKIYDYIYKQVQIVPGYERYYRYSEVVKKVNDPLSFLCNSENVYWAVREALLKYSPRKDNISILEIGSGLGYLTYSLNKAGYKTTGLDISSDAVKLAKQKYGDYYETGNLFVLAENRKHSYDYVIMTELIEHVEDPKSFIVAALSLLKEAGKLIITTPNKSAAPKGTIWQSDIPSVHLWFLAEESISYLANDLGKKCEFICFTDYTKKFYEQADITTIDQIQLGSPRLTKEGIVRPVTEASSLKKFFLDLIGFKGRYYLSYIRRRLKTKEISNRTTTLCAVIS